VSTFAIYWVRQKLLSPAAPLQWLLCKKRKHDFGENFAKKSLQWTWTGFVALVALSTRKQTDLYLKIVSVGWILPLVLWLVHSLTHKKTRMAKK